MDMNESLVKDRLNQELLVGDLVLFYQTRCGLLRGIVTKVNMKTVTVSPFDATAGEPNAQRQNLHASYKHYYWLPSSYFKKPAELLKVGHAELDSDNNITEISVALGDELLWKA